jgi:hypothetical protein
LIYKKNKKDKKKKRVKSKKEMTLADKLADATRSQ